MNWQILRGTKHKLVKNIPIAKSRPRLRRHLKSDLPSPVLFTTDHPKFTYHSSLATPLAPQYEDATKLARTARNTGNQDFEKAPLTAVSVARDIFCPPGCCSMVAEWL
jgi:hypothetical protein